MGQFITLFVFGIFLSPLSIEISDNYKTTGDGRDSGKIAWSLKSHEHLH